MVGGFKQVEASALLELQQDDSFASAENAARQAYRSERNAELGALVSVSEQVVSGMNYRMIFETEGGQFEVTVYVQPWTSTLEVLDMKPVTIHQ